MGTAKTVVSILLWIGVVLLASHQSEHPDVLGRYSWSYGYALALLIAVAGWVSLAGPSWLEKLYRARVAVVVSVSSFLFAVGAAELIFRVVDPIGLSNYEFSANYFLDMQPDDRLVYRHAPAQQKQYGRIQVSINEHGLRDRPIAEKHSDEYRVLALGDSVTFGWGVDQKDIFVSRLEPLLSARWGRPVRVINSGVGGYNTVQEVTYFKEAGRYLKPDLLILTYVENDTEVQKGPYDPWTSTSLRGKSLGGIVRTLAGRLWVYRFLDHAFRYGGRESTGGLPSEDAGWIDSMTAFSELVALCQEQHLPLIVFYFHWLPNPSEPLREEITERANGQPVFDIEHWFHGRDVGSLVNSKVDGHPNAEAHRVMAEHMAQEIEAYVARPEASVQYSERGSMLTPVH